MQTNRKQDRAKTLQRRSARTMKYAGLVETTVELEIIEGESRIYIVSIGGVQ